jgi:hypothetical protein
VVGVATIIGGGPTGWCFTTAGWVTGTGLDAVEAVVGPVLGVAQAVNAQSAMASVWVQRVGM